MARFRLALLFLLAASSVARAQPQPEDSLDKTHLHESNQLGTRFRNADARAAQQQWAEAIEEYQRILVEAGDELAPVDKRHVVQARWLAQAKLSALPREALTLYRSRIDPPAKKLLEQGRATRDPAPLQRIIDESFCSSYTDQALDLLGDLSFERGEFEEAEQFWRTVVGPASRPAGAPEAGLVLVDPKIDVAGIRAKQILAQLFRGEIDSLPLELQAFAAAHPGAKGHLAGRDGVYVDLLRALASRADELGAPLGSNAWSEFAGDAQRNRVLPKAEGRLARLPCAEGPAWQVRLDGQKLNRGLETPPADKIVSWTDAGRLLGYYPVISGDRVIVANAQYVTAYQLSTGLPVFKYDLFGEFNRDNSTLVKPGVEPDVAFPLTVVGDRIYARLGTKAAGPPALRGPGGRRRFGGGFGGMDFPRNPPPQTYLVCLTMQPNLGRQENWIQSPPPVEQGGTIAFEGAPIVHRRRVYIAITKFLTGSTQTIIACYDADSGNLRWQREACESPELKDGESRSRHHLLTLAGPNIVYCSQSGAIVALDAVTGQPRWGVRYASRGPKTADGVASFRSLTPCCYSGGRIFAAPLDLDHVLCLDSRTGQTLWESEPMEVVHILGASRGKVFFSTLTPRRGLRALDAATGSAKGGWMQPGDDSDLPTYGRGLLAGDCVFWPTRDGLHVLKQSDGEPVAFDPDIRGNLAAADGCLISADAKIMSAYLPEKWSLRRRTQEAAQDGADSSTLYRLGLSEMDAGFVDRALTTFDRALAMAGDRQQRDRARRKLHELLLQSAREAARGGDWKKVETWLKQAAADRFLASERVQAAALQGELLEESGKAEQAVAAWQLLLETAELRDALLSAGGQIEERASLIARDHLHRLLKKHGRAVYAAIEERAEKLAPKGGADPATMVRLEREFPQSLATMRVLEERARQAEKLDKPWEAASAYRALLDLPESPCNRMVLLAGLTVAYERENCWDAVRSTLDQIEREGGDRLEPAVHPTLTIHGWVRERRHGLPLPSSTPSVDNVFFNRHWQTAGDANGCAQLSESGDRLYRAAGSRLDCMSTRGGKPLWTRELPWPVHWLGVSADLLVAAGNREVLCMRQGDGATTWSQAFDLAEPATLHEFRIAEGRIFFFVGDSRFNAWEIASGRCSWCAWAPGSQLALESPAGCFAPHALAGPASCLLSTGFGRPLIIDSRTGARLHRDWRIEVSVQPLAIASEAQFGLLSGREAIQAVELSDGRPSWQFRFEAPHALAGEVPQVLQRDDRVFVQIGYNHGYLLEQIDGKTGKRIWPVPLFVGPRALDLDLGDIDETALYCSGPTGIEAIRLADGQVLWRQPPRVNSGRRKMQHSGSILLNQPASAEVFGWELAWQGLAIRVPALSHQSSQSYYCNLEILDPKTGQCLQSLNVAKPEPTTRFALARTSFSFGPVIRVLGAAAPTILHAPQRLLIAQGQAVTAFDVSTAGLQAGSSNESR